jgi:hypothetical protein
MFDGQIQHGTVNQAAVPRDVLLIDMKLTPDEVRIVWG